VGANGHAPPCIPDYDKLSALDWSLLLKVRHRRKEEREQVSECEKTEAEKN